MYIFKLSQLRVGVFRWRLKGRGRGEFFADFLTNEKVPRHEFSLLIGRDLWKNSQINSSLHLPLTLHLKTPTQTDQIGWGTGGGMFIKGGGKP